MDEGIYTFIDRNCAKGPGLKVLAALVMSCKPLKFKVIHTIMHNTLNRFIMLSWFSYEDATRHIPGQLHRAFDRLEASDGRSAKT
jgi:hypothetical protein